MLHYTVPDVYFEKTNYGVKAKGLAGQKAGLMGITERGLLGKTQLVTSWSDYVDKYAFGLNSPFYNLSDLAYSVYGYFQNGGKLLYLTRVASATAKKSAFQIGEESTAITITALEEGAWGNKIKFQIIKNEDDETLFDFVVSTTLQSGILLEVENFKKLSNTTTSANYYPNIINTSRYVSVNAGGTLIVTSSTSLSLGSDGISDITDTDYTTKISQWNNCPDIDYIAIPGQTSANIYSGLLDYAESVKSFAVIDPPMSATPESMIELRNTLDYQKGAMYYPHIRVNDPLTGGLRNCPNSGHILGLYTRNVIQNGIGKAPAGIEARLKGAINLVSPMNLNIELALISRGVNCIVSKSDYGVVVWGEDSLSNDIGYETVSHVLVDNYLQKELYKRAQYAIFETNNEKLWTRLITTAQELLNELWGDGAITGSVPEEAYLIKCDDEINTRQTIEQGLVSIQVGYNQNKTAKFIVFTLSLSLEG